MPAVCASLYVTDCAVNSELVLLTQNHIVHLVNAIITSRSDDVCPLCLCL